MTDTQTTHALDHVVLARLTGRLGDAETVRRLGSDVAGLYVELLSDILHGETGLSVAVTYLDCESALTADLVAQIGDDYTLNDVALRNWCPNFQIACHNSLPITVMAHLLGADENDLGAPVDRTLSKIERDIATLIFQKVAGILRSGVNPPGGFEPVLSEPYIPSEGSSSEIDTSDDFAVAVRLQVALGALQSEIHLIIPQQVLLKTKIIPPKARTPQGKAQKQWSDQIAEQVHRSHVTLEARVNLTPLKLSTISRLAAGDVIPFFDTKDVHVEVNANGKMLYACEFGRSGQNYTVRVKDNTSTDEEILRHLFKN
jgi:flagellar motor switch protein FliM